MGIFCRKLNRLNSPAGAGRRGQKPAGAPLFPKGVEKELHSVRNGDPQKIERAVELAADGGRKAQAGGARRGV
ncbi:MAG: hypothetical protein Kow00133_18780 [Amphiplicatus sp.]